MRYVQDQNSGFSLDNFAKTYSLNTKKLKYLVDDLLKNKGKSIILPSLESTRSSKSIVKESFFNTIQFEIDGKEFIEVFAGSGSIGIEALSRGASRVIFIEKDRDAFKILNQNIKNLNDDNYQTHFGDSFEIFPQVIKGVKSAIVYIDPPFMIRDGFDDIYTKVVDLIRHITKESCGLVVIEHQSGIEFPDEIADFKKEKSKKFGKTTLTYFR